MIKILGVHIGNFATGVSRLLANEVTYVMDNLLKSVSNTRGPKDVAPFHLLVIFENQNGFEM